MASENILISAYFWSKHEHPFYLGSILRSAFTMNNENGKIFYEFKQIAYCFYGFIILYTAINKYD